MFKKALLLGGLLGIIYVCPVQSAGVSDQLEKIDIQIQQLEEQRDHLTKELANPTQAQQQEQLQKRLVNINRQLISLNNRKAKLSPSGTKASNNEGDDLPPEMRAVLEKEIKTLASQQRARIAVLSANDDGSNKELITSLKDDLILTQSLLETDLSFDKKMTQLEQLKSRLRDSYKR